MRFLNFTPQETKALIFLLVALLLGSGIILYKRTHPGFAPQLRLEKSGIDSPGQAGYLSEPGLGENKIDLNQATAAELQLLPGLGPALSRRVVEFREAKGEFKLIEEIMQVPGIGPKTFERIKEYLTIEEREEAALK
jgi:competence ComEA-like helix-hairpin-helix protein